MVLETNSAPTPRPGVHRFPELDGLRGLLALWVVLSHIFAWTGFLPNPLPPIFNPLWAYFIPASSAVDLFIILSGFAITAMLTAQQPTYGRFMTGRFFRIYPVYLICLLLAVAVEPFCANIYQQSHWSHSFYFDILRPITASARAHFAQHFWWHLSLFHGLVPTAVLFGVQASILAPAWSLSLEWQYYLVAPIIRRLQQSRAGLVILAVATAIGLLLGPRLFGDFRTSFLLFKLPLFVLGAVSYHLIMRRFGRFSELSDQKLALIGFVSLGAAIPTCSDLLGLFVWPVIFVALLDLKQLGGLNNPFELVRATLLQPILQRLGAISYPLYLIHWVVIIADLKLMLVLRPGIHGGAAAVLLLITAVPGALLLASALHRWVERPGMDLGKRLISPPRAAFSPVPKSGES